MLTDWKSQSLCGRAPTLSSMARLSAINSLVRRVISSAEWFHEGGACGGVRDICVLCDRPEDQENGILRVDRERVLTCKGLSLAHRSSDRKSPCRDDFQLHLTATNPTARAPPHPRKVLGRVRDGSCCQPARSAMIPQSSACQFFKISF